MGTTRSSSSNPNHCRSSRSLKSLGVESDYAHQRGDIWTVLPGWITHLHRKSMSALREPNSTPDATQGAIDRILQGWPRVANHASALGEQVAVSPLEVKLEIDTDLEAPCRFRLTHDQLRLLADSTGLNVGLYDLREDPVLPVTPAELAKKQAGLVTADGGWVLQHAALLECDTWTLVNTAMLGCARFHHDAHWDTGLSLDSDDIHLLVDLDVAFDAEIWNLP